MYTLPFIGININTTLNNIDGAIKTIIKIRFTTPEQFITNIKKIIKESGKKTKFYTFLKSLLSYKFASLANKS